MSRKFKFRTWDKQCKQWTNLCHCSTSNGIPINSFFKSGNLEYIIQQFTGFLDKNGKEIYEGDIVDFHIKGHAHGPERELWENQEVFFDEEYGQWTFNREYLLSILDDIDLKSFIIKGNIFENPELLNKKNDNK